ncbi:MAG: DUF5130 family protein [Candidatus Nanopelagicales bacterium]
MARVQPGDGLTDAQRARLARAVETADRATGLDFLVRIGVLDGGRADAEALVAARGAEAPRTVLVAVDPPARALEIVTGSAASAVLDDRTCALASLTMTTSFAAGDLVGGLVRGLQVLSDHGRAVAHRHLDTL